MEFAREEFGNLVPSDLIRIEDQYVGGIIETRILQRGVCGYQLLVQEDGFHDAHGESILIFLRDIQNSTAFRDHVQIFHIRNVTVMEFERVLFGFGISLDDNESRSEAGFLNGTIQIVQFAAAILNEPEEQKISGRRALRKGNALIIHNRIELHIEAFAITMIVMVKRETGFIGQLLPVHISRFVFDDVPVINEASALRRLLGDIEQQLLILEYHKIKKNNFVVFFDSLIPFTVEQAGQRNTESPEYLKKESKDSSDPFEGSSMSKASS